MSQEKFNEKFQSMIIPDTSNWKNHPVADRAKREEFKQSQHMASCILEFLDCNPLCNREQVANTLGLSIEELNLNISGQVNFTFTMEELERKLHIIKIEMALMH
jgi:hypothetical protein